MHIANPFKYGIRAQLVMLLLLLAVPFLVHVALAYQRDGAYDRRQASVQMISSARLTAARLDDHVGDIEQLLHVLARVVGVEPQSMPANDALIRDLVPSLPPHIDDISVWTLDGTNVGSMHPQSRQAPFDSYDTAALHRAMAGSDVVVDAPIRSSVNGEWQGVFFQPVRRHGRVAGVIGIATQLGRLQDLLVPRSSLPEGTVLAVLDERGKLLARSIDPEKWIGTDLSGHDFFAKLRQQPQGSAEGEGLDRTWRIAGFTVMRRVPWHVYAAAPSSVVLEGVRSRTRDNLVFGLVMLLAGLAGATWLGNRIARPLLKLCEDASIIGSGKLEHRTKVAEVGETGVLAHTLNQMAEALQERSISLERSQAQLQQITDNVPALICYVDANKRFVFANRTFRDWLNFDPKEMIGRTLVEQYGQETYDAFADQIDKAFRGERVTYERELVTTLGTRYVQGTAVPHFDAQGRVEGVHVVTHDITARKLNEERLRQLAEFDLLTGLPNRGLFHDRLKQGMAMAARTGKPTVLMLLDVDYFKLVNDRLGHAAGDDLLRAFARRLQDTVRHTDTVGRLSGDEFAIVLLGVEDMRAASSVAQKVVDAIRVPMTVRDSELKVTTSVGVALCLPGESDVSDLMARADAALYRAKDRGRDGYCCDERG